MSELDQLKAAQEQFGESVAELREALAGLQALANDGELSEGALARELLKQEFVEIGGADPRRYRILLQILSNLFLALEVAGSALPYDDSELGDFLSSAKLMHGYATSRALPTFSDNFSHDYEASS